MEHYDIIVVGGGLNSLVSASILGKSGKKVLVLEGKDQVGGMAVTAEFASKYKCNILNDTIKWIDPRVMKQLDLVSEGLELVSPDVVRIALDQNGQHISFHQDLNQTAKSIANHSDKDAKSWQAFTTYIDNLSQFLEKLYELTPPKLPDLGLKEALSLRSMVKPIKKHGTRGLVDFMRVAPMMMPELMDEWFESELLRGAISTAGINHINLGPFAAATGYNLLHQHVHANGVFHHVQFVKGGTGNLANALLRSAVANGVEVRKNANVRSINVENGICIGITLNDEETIEAGQVISGLDPQNTFINLVGPSKLNPTFHTQLLNIKYRGSVARVHLALKALPEIEGIKQNHMNTVFAISPSIEYLERAADAAKYGRISEDPFIEFTFPSLRNPDFAPKGEHVLSATVQYAPYHLQNQNWSDDLKSQLKNNVIRIIGNYIPGFSGMVHSSVVFSPFDIEKNLGITEGNLNHGEMTLDQFLFMRPTMSSAQYKSPIENLFLCGPGTHPGGGLHGANGFNAAQKILSDRK